MRLSLGRLALMMVVGGGLVALGGLSPAQDEKGRAEDRPRGKVGQEKGPGAGQRASGVIVKVDRFKEGVNEGSTIEKQAEKGRQVPVTARLTINTAAPWRDYVREPETFKPAEKAEGKAGRDRPKGEDNTITTDGQPESPDTVVLVDVGPRTEMTLRYRHSSDEASEGAATPEEAEEIARRDPADDQDKPADQPGRKAGKALKVEDLKVGLFVEVEYRHVTAQNPASRLTVFQAVGGRDGTDTESAKPSKPE